jgi:hypothetical protein
MFVAYVFMVSFLFTVVNTQYGPGRLIETDLVSGFAAIRLPPGRECTRMRGILPGDQGIYYPAIINNCEVRNDPR